MENNDNEYWNKMISKKPQIYKHKFVPNYLYIVSLKLNFLSAIWIFFVQSKSFAAHFENVEKFRITFQHYYYIIK